MFDIKGKGIITNCFQNYRTSKRIDQTSYFYHKDCTNKTVLEKNCKCRHNKIFWTKFNNILCQNLNRVKMYSPVLTNDASFPKFDIIVKSSNPKLVCKPPVIISTKTAHTQTT